MPDPTASINGSPSRARLIGTRVIVPAALLGLGVLGFVYLAREPEQAKKPPAKPQPIRTKVLELRPREYPVIVKTHGIVRAQQETALSALVSGKIARLSPAFEDGAFFRQGEILVELEAPDYRNAVAVAQARLAGARAAGQLARLNHERNIALLAENLLPQTQADVTEAALAQSTAEIDSAQAQLERAQRDLERTQIRAPFDGCVRRRSAGLGQLVSPGTALGVIFAVDRVEVRLPIGSREQRFLRLPRPQLRDSATPAFRDSVLEVELRDAITRDSEQVWRGRIVRTEGTLDENSLELFAIAEVDDPFGLRSGHPPLRIGQAVTGWIRGETLTNVLVLPRAAVRQLDRISLVDPERLTLQARTIAAIWSDEAHVIVRDHSIPPGLLLATTHLVYAPDGAQVEIVPDIAPEMSSASPASNATHAPKPDAKNADNRKS